MSNEWKIITFSSMSNGVGKTHLLFCLYIKYIYEKIEKGEIPSCIFVKEYDLCFEIQETYKTDFYKSEREVMDKYISEKKLLAIDDLFSTKDNEFARQKILFCLIKEQITKDTQPLLQPTYL